MTTIDIIKVSRLKLGLLLFLAGMLGVVALAVWLGVSLAPKLGLRALTFEAAVTTQSVVAAIRPQVLPGLFANGRDDRSRNGACGELYCWHRGGMTTAMQRTGNLQW